MKSALVTGGSRGIGRAISLLLAQQDYHVLINYRQNRTAARQVCDLIREDGGSAEIIGFNVSDNEAVQESMEHWTRNNPEKYIEVLVNNAGIKSDHLLFMMPEKEWHTVMDTNVNGFFYVTRLIVKGMLRRKYGRIINVVSLSGLKGMSGQTNYSAAKAAVIGATRSLASEVGKRNITVNAVAPGFIGTEMIQDINEEDHKALIPLNRFGKPEEVAHLVGFLASVQSSYLTGQVISINGGLY